MPGPYWMLCAPAAAKPFAAAAAAAATRLIEWDWIGSLITDLPEGLL